MRKKIYYISLAVIALALVLALVWGLGRLVLKKDLEQNVYELWKQYYAEPEDAVDVVFIGASYLYRGVNPGELYMNQGITSYNLSTPCQRDYLEVLYVREAFRTQKNIKLVVIYYNPYNNAHFVKYEGQYRVAMDNIRMSPEKLKLARKMTRVIPDASFLSYIFPLLRYHGRWNEVDFADEFRRLTSTERYPLKGYISSGCYAETIGNPLWYEKTDEVDREYAANAQEYLSEIQRVCEENGAQLLVVWTPRTEFSTYAEMNGTQELLEKMGIDFLDLNREENWKATGIDHTRDFCDGHHLNLEGADKMTCYLGNYIREQYELPDHRGDPDFAVWAEDAAKVRTISLDSIRQCVDSPTPGTSASVCAKKKPDGSVAVRLPELSYITSVSLYRTGDGGQSWTCVCANADSTGWVDTEPGENPGYKAVFTIEGNDTPYEILFPVEEGTEGKTGAVTEEEVG